MLATSTEKRLRRIALLIGPLVTITITPDWNYDPINLGKILVLASLAFACIGLLLSTPTIILERLGKTNLAISIFFVVSLWSSFFFSGANKSQQFWGTFGRNTGIFTYLALIAIWIVFIVIRHGATYLRAFTFLIATGLFMTLYALIQLTGNDPIKWSSYAAFGTLGNVNFLSGFMGVSAVAMFCLGILPGSTLRTRSIYLLFCVLGMYVVSATDSIQGLVAFGAGAGSLGLLLTLNKGLKYFLPFLSLSIAALSMTVLALFNKGPLANLIYQVTILYRADYMGAGLRMMVDKPFFGVGIDSYDDWYRSERGVISAFRTGFTRTANTAHNIAIDLGAGGGFPLFISYLLLILVVISCTLKGLSSGLAKDRVFGLAVCTWIAYQVQAAVSINQIGVGVWGWIISGILVGYVRLNLKSQESSDSKQTNEPLYLQEYDFFKDFKAFFKSGHQKRGGSLKTRALDSQPNTPPAAAVVTSFFCLAWVSFFPFCL